MVPRELIALATLTTLSVAAATSIDFDLAAANAAGGDYEVQADNEERTAAVAAAAAAAAAVAADHDDFTDNERIHSRHHREVRCFCNQPHCVSQGYMCRGRGCFTELPPLTTSGPHGQHQRQQLALVSSGRPEHAVYSGCLEKSFAERPCPPGKLCCDQDLCNHVDSPAMRLRLNKTLQVLLGEHRAYFDSVRPAGQAVQTSSSDGWFRTATIAVPICGFVVLLILASLAIRLLQPIPSPNDKLNGLRMPESAPPLLGPPNKMPLV